MEDAVAEFSWTEREFCSAIRLSFPARLIAWSTVSGCAIVLLGILSAVLGYWEGAVFIPLGIINAIYVRLLPRILSRKAWKASRGLDGPTRFTFSEAGVATESEGSTSARAWSRMPVIVEREEFYFLKLNAKARGMPLPRRAFLSPRDEENFRALSRAKATTTFLAHPELKD